MKINFAEEMAGRCLSDEAMLKKYFPDVVLPEAPNDFILDELERAQIREAQLRRENALLTAQLNAAHESVRELRKHATQAKETAKANRPVRFVHEREEPKPMKPVELPRWMRQGRF